MSKNDRSKIISTWLSQFNSHYKTMQCVDPTVRIDDNFLQSFYEMTMDIYGESLSITDEEKEDIIRKIKASYSVYQDEGYAIIGDYDHDFEWYNKFKQSDKYDDYYWLRYKLYLQGKNFSDDVIDKLENSTLEKIMSYIGNPAEEIPYSIRGLVVGDVQSGKTSNYIGLITKAADAGYRVVFLLTGTIESLRKQTQIRVEEGFIGYDSVNAVDVGVGRGTRTPKAFTSREKDFTGTNDQNTTYKISEQSSEPMIFVIKKNVSVLKKLYASLKNINTNQFHTKINAQMLMIDDEADNASINTNKPDDDPTKINNYIRKILSLFSRNTYVGFTATPFANVFISYDSEKDMLDNDLFPRDFIYALEAPSNYCGAKKYFFESNDNVKFIRDADDSIFPMTHKKDWEGTKLFDSLYRAIDSFLLINAIRDKREVVTNTNRSMLINISRFTNVQLIISDIVQEYYDEVKRTVKLTHRTEKEDYLKNPIIKRLYDLYNTEFSKPDYLGRTYSWEEIFSLLYDSIKDIEVVVVNSSKHSKKLNYDEHKKDGLRVIAVGGLALSRGLTLEGLCVSYFYRNTSTFDVLMQMGRWFGYRDEYEDLCRIWLTRSSFDFYKEISLSIDDLKHDIRRMGEQNKRPQDYGIRVRNNSSAMGITAANKMRSTRRKIIRKSFNGSVFETPYLYKRNDYMEENIENSIDFLASIDVNSRDKSVTHPYFRNINSEDIVELLGKLHIHEANENFDVKQLVSFIKNNNDIRHFDVLVMGGASRKEINLEPDIHDLCVDRQYDIVNRNGNPDDEIIRMSKQRAHLWGPRDTANGLDKGELELLKNKYMALNAQDFMIKGRNPLFIMYFINPTNKDMTNEDVFSSDKTPCEQLVDSLEIHLDMKKSKYDYLIGYAIGFPASDTMVEGTEHYFVNTTCSYYDKQHEEDQEMYGEEL